IAQTRKLHRKKRDAVPYPVIALVGYTNAGKSTLFNRITGAKVMAKDLLFATLDTTVRKAKLPHGRTIMLSDTVGFISELPTDLIAAFRATLEEVIGADIILHVRDVSSEDNVAQAQDVISVLTLLGVNGEETPIIEVYNKIDMLEKNEEAEDAIDNIIPVGTVISSIALSAVSGEGIDELLLEIEKTLAQGAKSFKILLEHERGEDAAWLYEHSEIIERVESDEGSEFTIRVEPRYLFALQSRFGKKLTGSIL
ncbi:MAG: 50S ribosome-binding GTPase, partial [Devosiaceae bacterium]|nr:50S ribosome-binding GTPase [Devosiaceae bacterium]